MIHKWKEFNELNKETYFNAADKIEKYGDKQGAEQLRKHAESFDENLLLFHFRKNKNINHKPKKLKFIGSNIDMTKEMFYEDQADDNTPMVNLQLYFIDTDNNDYEYTLNMDYANNKINVEFIDEMGNVVYIKSPNIKEAKKLTKIIKKNLSKQLKDGMKRPVDYIPDTDVEFDKELFIVKYKELVNNINYRVFLYNE